jgi:hypothetical protein
MRLYTTEFKFYYGGLKMFKRVLLVLLLLVIVGSSNLLADHIMGYTVGGAVIGVGLCFIITPILLFPDDPAIGMYVAGGALIVGGLSWLLWDLFTHPSRYASNSSSSEIIPAFVKHISIGVMPNKTFIGVNFKF